MFASIIDGEKPAQLFKRLMAEDPALTNRQLASLFYEAFPNVDGVAVQHIWHWKSSKKPSGNWSDEDLNERLCELLASAGYLHASSRS
jgi:hypothetical protein